MEFVTLLLAVLLLREMEESPVVIIAISLLTSTSLHQHQAHVSAKININWLIQHVVTSVEMAISWICLCLLVMMETWLMEMDVPLSVRNKLITHA